VLCLTLYLNRERLGAEEHAASRLPIRALRQAVVTHQPTPGLVHHSDRGVQYVSDEYVHLLQDPSHDPEHEQNGKPLR
jgi:transposase InsO family protein